MDCISKGLRVLTIYSYEANFYSALDSITNSLKIIIQPNINKRCQKPRNKINEYGNNANEIWNMDSDYSRMQLTRISITAGFKTHNKVHAKKKN